MKYEERINTFTLLPKIPPFLKSLSACEATSDFIRNNVVIEDLQTRSIEYGKGPLKDVSKYKFGAQRVAKERQCLLI